MLEGIRAAQSTWIGKALTTLIFGVILLAFVIWGMGDPFRGASATTVAQVGDVTVTTAAYRQAYEAELQALERQAHRVVTNEEAHRFGLDAQVLSRLVSNAVLDDAVGRLGLAMSDADVAHQIVADPTFAGPDGRFDRERLNEILFRNNLTEQGFVRDQRLAYLRQDLLGALIGDLAAPQAAIEALHRYEGETRSLDYVTLPASVAGPVPAPDEAALKAYYDAHKGAFTAPAYRKLVVLAVTPSTLAKPSAVPDSDVTALYDQEKDRRFTTPEKRALREIVFGTEAEAQAFASKAQASSFDDALKADGLTAKAVDLGTVTRAELFDPAVAAAAFALPADGTSGPVKSQAGVVVLHVGAVIPSAVQPLATVADTLRTEIASRQARQAVDAARDKVEAARSSGKPLAEAAAAAGFQARTIEAVDAQGLDRSGQPIADLPDEADLLRAAFASDVGVDNDPISTADGGTVWYEVAAIDPARDLTFDEARAKVEAAWREEEAAKRLDAKTADFVKAIDAGQQTVEGIAQSLGLSAQHLGDAKRSAAKGLDARTLARVFETKVGSAGSAATGPDQRILFRVFDSQVSPLDPEAPDTKQLASRYSASLQESVAGAYVAATGATLNVKINQAAVQSATHAGS